MSKPTSAPDALKTFCQRKRCRKEADILLLGVGLCFSCWSLACAAQEAKGSGSIVGAYSNQVSPAARDYWLAVKQSSSKKASKGKPRLLVDVET